MARPAPSLPAAPRDPALEPIYRSETLSVWRNRGSTGPAGPAALLTFEGIGIAVRKQNGDYFAAPLAPKLGIDILHVVPRDTEWYHYPDMADCLAALRPHIDPATLAYGSSMGGYGVAHFADRLGLRRGLCLSPQISINPAVVPFETRWQTEAARIAFLHDDTIAPRDCRLWVFTDTAFPEELEHARMIAASGPTEIVAVDHAGHPVGPALREIGALGPIIDAFLAGKEDAALFAGLIGDRVAVSAAGMLQQAMVTRGRNRTALLLEAFRAHPKDSQIRFRLGLALLKSGRTEKAERLLRPLMRQPTPKMAATYRRICAQAGLDPALLDGR